MSKRLAAEPRKKPLILRILGKFYALLVVFSVLVIGVYLASNYWIKPPSVAEPPVLNQVKNPAEPLKNGEAQVEDALVRKERFYNILLVGCDDGHGNADTVIMLSYDIPNEKISLISVPRDTLIQRDSGVPKLNAAYAYGGLDLLKQEVTETLGVPIDYYVKVELNAFVKIVDALGGLDFYVPQDMYHDDEAGFVINLQAGQQHLTGYQTLQLVRYRTYADADVGRTRVQQQVLAALAKKAISWSSVTKIQTFLDIFMTYVDTDLSAADMLYFAKEAMSLKLDEVLTTCTLDGRGDANKGSYMWCYELDAQATLETVNTYMNPYTTDRTAEDLELVQADSYYFNY